MRVCRLASPRITVSWHSKVGSREFESERWGGGWLTLFPKRSVWVVGGRGEDERWRLREGRWGLGVGGLEEGPAVSKRARGGAASVVSSVAGVGGG